MPASRFGPLALREFRLLFLGRLVSNLGTAMTEVALIFAVLDVYRSSAALGLVLASAAIPGVALILLGGVLADRWPRRNLMIGGELIGFVGQGLLAALLLVGAAPLWAMAVLSALTGLGGAFLFPAMTGLVPETVPAAQLQQANALRGLYVSTSAIVGPAIAGVLVATAGPGWAIAADAATFGLGALFLARLRVGRTALPSGETMVRALVLGWDTFRSRTWLWVDVVRSSLWHAVPLAGFLVAGAVVAKASLGGAPAWAAIQSTAGVGAVIGALVALRLRPRRPLIAANLAISLYALPLALLAARTPLWVVCLGALPGGIGVPVFSALWTTTLQREVAPDVLSRVSAFQVLGSHALLPVGLAVAGPLVAVVGAAPVLWVGAAYVLGSGAVVLALPSVRGLTAPAAV
ncbi:MAG TPA: MFS transporter [Candidatus Micrarchaeia archaeon]|nr:MFS transporter [Candidatus Micrarchaeia archaeon]